MAYDTATGQQVAEIRDGTTCSSHDSLLIAGDGMSERLIVFPDERGSPHSRTDFRGFIGGFPEELRAYDIGGAQPSQQPVWRLGPAAEVGFDAVLGVSSWTAPDRPPTWAPSPGVATDDSLIFATVTFTGEGTGEGIVELVELALADGTELGRTELPMPNEEDADGNPTPMEPQIYLWYDLIVSDDTLLVAAPSERRGRSTDTLSSRVGFLAAFDVTGRLSGDPLWFKEGSRTEGFTAWRYPVISDGAVVGQPVNQNLQRPPIEPLEAYDLRTGELRFIADGRQCPVEGCAPSHLRGQGISDANGAIYTRAFVSQAPWAVNALVKLDATGSETWRFTDRDLAQAHTGQPQDDADPGSLPFTFTDQNPTVGPIADDGTLLLFALGNNSAVGSAEIRSTIVAIDNSGGLAQAPAPTPDPTPDPTPVPTFTDVDPANVHAPGINAVAAAGITTGCAPGRFCPADNVTRAQMATFLYRALLQDPAPAPQPDPTPKPGPDPGPDARSHPGPRAHPGPDA